MLRQVKNEWEVKHAIARDVPCSSFWCLCCPLKYAKSTANNHSCARVKLSDSNMVGSEFRKVGVIRHDYDGQLYLKLRRPHNLPDKYVVPTLCMPVSQSPFRFDDRKRSCSPDC